MDSIHLPFIKKKAAEEKALIVFGDEASFHQSPTLHATWAPRHSQPGILSNGQRNTQKIFGAVALPTGESLFRRREAYFNHETYVEFLDDITKAFYKRGHRIYLIQDNASYHKHPKTYEWFSANRKYLEVFNLPPYSPDFNAQEKLWKYTRKQATHNRYHKTESELQAALTKTFDTMKKNPELIIPLLKSFL
jgi:transposase